MKSILLTIFFFAAIASAKCETPATETTKTDVKTEKTATPAKEEMKDATAKSNFVGTSELYLNLIREGVKRA
ncbi:MAG: hypothetical protein JWO03_3109 [Bacteroidetes bacterium]|nr:hypothetical protein [Bacteroidota bacterium]